MFVNMEDRKITRNFRLSEAIRSDSHPDLAEKIPLTPQDAYKFSLLCRLILQPARYSINQPIRITSGKCTFALNCALKRDTKTTEHDWSVVDNCAVDIIVLTDDGDHDRQRTVELFYWLLDHKRDCIGQLIYYPVDAHLHLSLPSERHFRGCSVKVGDDYINVSDCDV
jgi:hypothetical protein